jgi:hypothetical protein
MGRDPATEVRERRRSSADAYTFDDAVRDYAAHAKRTLRAADEVLALLGIKPDEEGKMKPTRGGLAERWRERAVAAITTAEVFAVRHHCGARGHGLGEETPVAKSSSPLHRQMQ